MSANENVGIRFLNLVVERAFAVESSELGASCFMPWIQKKQMEKTGNLKK